MPKPSPRWPAIATRLTMLALLFGVVVGLAIVGTSVAGAIAGHHSVALHQTVALDKISSLPPHAVATQAVPVTIELRDGTSQQLLLATVRDLLPVVLGLPILWFLLGIVRSVRDGDPFVSGNVHRLRGIGFVLLIGFPVAGMLTSTLEQALAN